MCFYYSMSLLYDVEYFVWFVNCVVHLKFQFQFSLVLFPSLDWTLTEPIIILRKKRTVAKGTMTKKLASRSRFEYCEWHLRMNEWKEASSDRQIFLTSVGDRMTVFVMHVFEHKLRSISLFNHGQCVKSILLTTFTSNEYHFLLMFLFEI